MKWKDKSFPDGDGKGNDIFLKDIVDLKAKDCVRNNLVV